MRGLLGAIAAAALVAGCGSDDVGQAQTVEETSTTANAEETTTSQADESVSADLESVVVQLGDLPAGWTVEPDAGSEDGSDYFCSDEPPDELPDPLEEVESSFSRGDTGPFVGSNASLYGSTDEAEAAFDIFVAELSKCDGFTEGAETTWSLSALSFPDVGDDTFAARLSATTMLGPLVADVVVERSDDVTLFVTNGGYGSPDTALTEELLRTMDGRL